MNWLFYSLIAMFGFAGYGLVSRVAGVKSINPRAFSVVFNVMVALATVPLLLATRPSWPEINFRVLVLTGLGLLAWTAFSRIDFLVSKYVEASTKSIITQLAPVLTLVYSVLLLNESLSVNKVVGLIIIVVANILVGVVSRKQGGLSKKGLLLALVLTALMSIAWVFDKLVVPAWGPILFVFIAFAVPALLNSLAPPLSKETLILEYQNFSRGLVVLALLMLLPYLAMMQALIVGEVSKVVPVVNASTPLVVILAAIFLKERGQLPVKLLAGAMVLVGIFFLSQT